MPCKINGIEVHVQDAHGGSFERIAITPPIEATATVTQPTETETITSEESLTDTAKYDGPLFPNK